MMNREKTPGFIAKPDSTAIEGIKSKTFEANRAMAAPRMSGHELVVDNEVMFALNTEFFRLNKLHNKFFEEWIKDNRDFFKTVPHDKGGVTEKGINWASIGGDTLALLKVAGVKNGTRVLDFGSGSGFFDINTAIILEADVTGIEYNKSLVQFANETEDWFLNKGHLKTPGPKFIQGDFLEHNVSPYDVLYYFDKGTNNPRALEAHVLENLARGSRFVVYHYDPLESHPFERLREKFQTTLVYRADILKYPFGAIFTNSL